MFLNSIMQSIFVVFVMFTQGMTAEIYIHGIDLLCDNIGVWGLFLVIVTFVPIFYKLKPTTVFEVSTFCIFNQSK